MLRHILRNALPPLIVLMTMEMGVAILVEAALSFIGIGLETHVAAWGSMVSEGYKHLFTHPMLSFTPGLAIMLVVFGFNMAGNGPQLYVNNLLRSSVIISLNLKGP